MEQWDSISDLTSQERWDYICTEKYIYFDVDLRLPSFYPDLDFVKKPFYINTHACARAHTHTHTHTHIYICIYIYIYIYEHIYKSILLTLLCVIRDLQNEKRDLTHSPSSEVLVVRIVFISFRNIAKEKWVSGNCGIWFCGGWNERDKYWKSRGKFEEKCWNKIIYISVILKIFLEIVKNFWVYTA